MRLTKFEEKKQVQRGARMNNMNKHLKIANHITAYISLLALALFIAFFIQVTFVKFNGFFSCLTQWFTMVSFILSMPTAIILFCIRRFFYKEKISPVFTILVFVETLLTYLIFFNVGNILCYVFD